MITVLSLSETYVPTFGRYGDKGGLYVGFNTDEGGYWADLTVNFPGIELGAREVFINANTPDPSLIDATEAAGHFTYTGRAHRSGFVTYRVARLSEAFFDLATQEADKDEQRTGDE